MKEKSGFISQKPLPFFKIKKIYLGNKMSIKEQGKLIKFCCRNKIEYVGLVRANNSFDLVECSGDCFTCDKSKMVKSV